MSTQDEQSDDSSSGKTLFDCCVPIVDFLKKKITQYPYWRIFISVLFTILHDAAGLFSATPTIVALFRIFPEDWMNIVVVVAPIVIIDCGSELMLVLYHDLPLCERREFSVAKIRVALAGQVLTSLIWITLFCLVAYISIFEPCLNKPEHTFLKCPALTSGISATIVVFMVFIKNSFTLKDYWDRAYKYPVICHESLLFLYHLLRNDPSAIVDDYKKFYGFDEDAEMDCTNEPTYNAIINFATLLLMDVAAIASVSNVIIVPGDAPFTTFLRALPFLGLTIMDIFSEVLILLYHDIPLCNQEEKKILKHNKKFQLGRFLQIVVLVGWICALVYMVIIVRNLDCENICRCYAENPDISCTDPICPLNGTCTTEYCSFFTDPLVCHPFGNDDNFTAPIPPKLEEEGFDFQNCTITYKKKTCIQTHPSAISCVLLALILFEGLYQTMGIFFKSYLLPITLPDSIMFQLYIMTDEMDALINRLGQSEFGFHWSKKLLETLIENDNNNLL